MTDAIRDSAAKGISPINRLILLQRNRVKHERERLAAQAALLRDEMDRVVKQCSKDDPIIDSLGVVQNLGNQVDAACGRYTAARDALEEMIARVD